MPTDFEILSQMIVEGAKVFANKKKGKTNLKLVEPQCPESAVTISNLPEKFLVIDLDSNWPPPKIFKSNMGQCKRADYIIVCEDKKVIIFIELKKKKGKYIVKQLTGSKCFIEYCQKIGQAEAFWNKPDFLNHYNHRFVSIGSSRNPTKTPTRSKNDIHDQPNKMLKLFGNRYMLNRLIGVIKND